ncbi:hypothetical protein PgNI_06054 [Pyricularia grisea]|uniref:Uncharacterized protein n=1 Tax=Pyricularia grisea TaxID=148305 RepID=A0A6P8B731_PYRGI|nr:hypothetical protein PgNI_06054 [Pyricularia grisea]TLD11080.1 hypothetical protein PgNI_06054 [Pyricularia grisea]
MYILWHNLFISLFPLVDSFSNSNTVEDKKWNPPPVLAEHSGARTTSSNPHPAGPSQCKLNAQAF